MRIVYSTRMPVARELIVAGIQALPGVVLEQYDDVEQILAALPGADGLITFDYPAPVARRIIDVVSAPDATLRWMHVIPAGREGFIEAGIPAHLHVTGADGAHSPTVSEHALALMLSLVRHVPQAAAMTRSGKWDRGIGQNVGSLEGQKLMVIGTGAIGSAIAERARLFRMHTTGISRSGQMKPEFDEVRPLSQLDETLGEADMVAIAIALAAETRGMFDVRRIRLMKKGAILINIARGGIVDSDALADALSEGRLGGAGLDVTEPEPLPDGHRLWSAPNLIITPHLAGFGSEFSRQRLAEAAINAARRQMKQG